VCGQYHLSDAGLAPGPVWTVMGDLASTGILSLDHPAWSHYTVFAILVRILYMLTRCNCVSVGSARVVSV